MDRIVIVRFRSTFEGGCAVLTAQLAPLPTDRWRALCEANLARYALGFGRTPELLNDALIVSTTSRELATSEMALRTLVLVTNELAAQERADHA